MISQALILMASLNLLSDFSTQPRALIVVTSHSELGDTGRKTGLYLSEVVEPYLELTRRGIRVDVASPKGRQAPIEPKSLNDDKASKFLESPATNEILRTTILLSEIDPNDYDAVIYAGGHGVMWDLPELDVSHEIISSVYQSGGIVAAICHGTAALTQVKIESDFLVKGRRVTGFTTKEESLVKLTSTVPFLLEQTLEERGAIFHQASPFQENVLIDGRIITGQNPRSAASFGREVARAILSREMSGFIEANYIEGAFNSLHTNRLRESFHSEFQMVWLADNERKTLSLTEWIELIEKQKREGTDRTIKHSIDDVNISDDGNSASVRLTLHQDDNPKYQDFIFLKKNSAGWKVIHKYFETL